MHGLLKTWRMMVVAAEKRMTKAKARKAKGEKARIDKAVRLLRKGAISRARKALESKGRGDLDDPDIWIQIDGKHPDKKRGYRNMHMNSKRRRSCSCN
jgi:hypothetical protein